MQIRVYVQILRPGQKQPGDETGPELTHCFTDHELTVSKGRATNQSYTNDTFSGHTLPTIHFSHCPHCKN